MTYPTSDSRSFHLTARTGAFNVRAFGACGDGQALDTPAIQNAITAAHEAGGGIVFFPPGTYLSTTLRLRSRVVLSLGPGAALEAADYTRHPFDPPEPESVPGAEKLCSFGHSHWHNSLVCGVDLDDIGIIGPGRIQGFGLIREDEVPAGAGNKAIALKHCRNVLLRDFSMLQGGHFAILASGVDNLTIDNLTIDTNRDAIDIDCCRNVRVSNCRINSPFDDAICLKSSYALGYIRPTENVTVTNCQVSGYDMGTLLDGTCQRTVDFSVAMPAGQIGRIRFGPLAPTVARRSGPTGRIKLGTESNGGFRNVTIANCVFDYCRGLALEAVDGGMLEDVTVTNLTMRGITNAPLFLRLGNRARGPGRPPVGRLRRVTITNVTAFDSDPRYGCIISGIPGHPIEELRLENVHLVFRGGGTREDAALEPGEHEGAYPEPHTFGRMPSYGFFLRHVRDVALRNIKVEFLAGELRPALILEDAEDVQLVRVSAAQADSVPLLRARRTRRLSVQHSRHLPSFRDRDFEREATLGPGQPYQCS